MELSPYIVLDDSCEPESLQVPARRDRLAHVFKGTILKPRSSDTQAKIDSGSPLETDYLWDSSRPGWGQFLECSFINDSTYPFLSLSLCVFLQISIAILSLNILIIVMLHTLKINQ